MGPERLIEIRARFCAMNTTASTSRTSGSHCAARILVTRLRFCGGGLLAATGLLAEVGRSVIEIHTCPCCQEASRMQAQRSHGRSAGPHPYWVIQLNGPADATELRDRFRIWPRSA